VGDNAREWVLNIKKVQNAIIFYVLFLQRISCFVHHCKDNYPVCRLQCNTGANWGPDTSACLQDRQTTDLDGYVITTEKIGGI